MEFQLLSSSFSLLFESLERSSVTLSNAACIWAYDGRRRYKDGEKKSGCREREFQKCKDSMHTVALFLSYVMKSVVVNEKSFVNGRCQCHVFRNRTPKEYPTICITPEGIDLRGFLAIFDLAR